MKLRNYCVQFVASAIVLGGLAAVAQGPGPRNNMRMYDPATETTFKGTVDSVTAAARGQMPMMMGTHLTVKVGDETHTVVLGPSTFVTAKGFSFAKGDSIDVTGSKIAMGGTDYIIAREVVKDGKTLTLRDKSGVPQWAGSGRGRMMQGR